MKNGAIAALLVCGTVCAVAACVYSAYHNHLVSEVLEHDGMKAATFFSEFGTALKWWTMLIGTGMIVVGIVGSLRECGPRSHK
jgi:hypothetical protein